MRRRGHSRDGGEERGSYALCAAANRLRSRNAQIYVGCLFSVVVMLCDSSGPISYLVHLRR